MKLGEAERDQKAPNLLVSPIPAPIFGIIKPYGPDAASSSGSPEAAACQKQGRNSHCVFLGVASLCQRPDRGENCGPVQIGSSVWGPLRCAASDRIGTSGM